MKFILRSATHVSRRNCWEAIKGSPDGYEVIIREPKRSLPQNAKMHALIGRLGKTGYKWQGHAMSKDTWKIFFSAALFGQIVIPNMECNGFVACGYHTSEMSERQASQMIELIYAFCAHQGIDLGPEIEPEELIR